jgi:hypothetical protein
MPLDSETIRRGSKGTQVTTAHQLCRTQEAPFFLEIAAEHAAGADIRCVNIRELAGWSMTQPVQGRRMRL